MELEENTDSYWSRYRSGKDAELTFTRYKGGGAAVVEHSDHPGEAFVMNDGDNGRGQVTFAPELDELFWLSICWKASAYLMES